jgi:hypothetical protein
MIAARPASPLLPCAPGSAGGIGNGAARMAGRRGMA